MKQPIKIRPAAHTDLREIVLTHQAAFPGFFLSQLGPAFLRAYYETILRFHGGILLVAECDRKVIGFVAGFLRPELFYRGMSHRKLHFALPVLLGILRKPSNLPRVLERYNVSRSTYGDTKAILLAAGLGTRLRPLTNSIPKCLLPIGGKPLLQYWFENLITARVREVLVNTHWLHERVESFIADWNDSSLRVMTFHEPVLLGSAGTILATREWWKDTSELLILYADNFTTVRLEDVLNFHRFHDLPFTLGIFETDEPQRCGIVELDKKEVVVDFVEKPENPRTNLAAGGIYVADPFILKEVLDWDLNAGEPYDLGRHVLPHLVGRMMAYRLQGLLLDIGTPESYRYAQEICKRRQL